LVFQNDESTHWLAKIIGNAAHDDLPLVEGGHYDRK
jgi:hypothetical protein